MKLDKVCAKILSALYDNEIEENEIAAMIGWKSISQPNEHIDYLMRTMLIRRIMRDAVPDGEGGYKDNTGTAYYQITVQGKAEYEHLRKRRIEKALDLAANLSPL